MEMEIRVNKYEHGVVSQEYRFRFVVDLPIESENRNMVPKCGDADIRTVGDYWAFVEREEVGVN